MEPSSQPGPPHLPPRPPHLPLHLASPHFRPALLPPPTKPPSTPNQPPPGPTSLPPNSIHPTYQSGATSLPIGFPIPTNWVQSAHALVGAFLPTEFRLLPGWVPLWLYPLQGMGHTARTIPLCAGSASLQGRIHSVLARHLAEQYSGQALRYMSCHPDSDLPLFCFAHPIA